jgi:hypothetical protein
MPRDPFIREKFTRERIRQEVGRGIFPALSEGAVPDRSRELAPSAIAKRRLQSQNIAFTMKRLREPIEGGG